MITTRAYRGRHLAAEGLTFDTVDVGNTYPTDQFGLKDLRLMEGDRTRFHAPEAPLGSQSDRWGSWIAWDECGFFALLGDFVLYCETEGEGMGMSDEGVSLKAMYLVQPEQLDGARVDPHAGMLLLQEYADLNAKDKAFYPRKAVVALSHMHAYEELRPYWIAARKPAQASENGPPASCEVGYDEGSLQACGGAARLRIDGVYRWIVPHPEGPAVALARVRASAPDADWACIEPLLESASAAERALVSEHFLSLGDEHFRARVAERCQTPAPG